MWPRQSSQATGRLPSSKGRAEESTALVRDSCVLHTNVWEFGGGGKERNGIKAFPVRIVETFLRVFLPSYRNFHVSLLVNSRSL